MTVTDTVISADDERVIREALPAVRASSPEAADAISRLLQAVGIGAPRRASRYVSIREVARTFEVTE